MLVAAQSTCRQPTGSDFRVVTLVGPNMGLQDPSKGPVHLAIAPDGRVFIAKMSGEIRVYNPTPNNPANTQLGTTIPTFTQTEDGLLGIALDPDFANTGWLYAFYSDPCGRNCPNRAMELARFTVSSKNEFSAKKVLLRFPRATDDTRHAAGGLDMDDDGVLVIAVGDNTDPTDNVNARYGSLNIAREAADAQRTASNTNDLRGKILRIKPIRFADGVSPTPGPGSTYDIPKGNLWEKITDKNFNPNWNNSDNLDLVRKEIYTFGLRNPYRARVDSKTGWIFWGNVGPDAASHSATRGPAGKDSWNLATEPGFFGFPYCNGYNVPYNRMVTADPPTYGAKFNCLAVINESPNNTGIKYMPPSKPALVEYGRVGANDDPRFNKGTNWANPDNSNATAIGGPMYRYDPTSTSAIRFPPYYEGKVFFFDWHRQIFRWITLTSDGKIPAGTAGVEDFKPDGNPSPAAYVDAQFGPDGALYLLKYSDRLYTLGAGPRLFRVEYKGPQDAACYKPFESTVGIKARFEGRHEVRRLLEPKLSGGAYQLPAGYSSLVLYDLSGRQIWSYSRASTDAVESVRLPSHLVGGLLWAKALP